MTRAVVIEHHCPVNRRTLWVEVVAGPDTEPHPLGVVGLRYHPHGRRPLTYSRGRGNLSPAWGALFLARFAALLAREPSLRPWFLEEVARAGWSARSPLANVVGWG